MLRTDKEITDIYLRHADTVWRVCCSFMKNTSDAEDVVQETFLRLLTTQKQFESAEHEKAWLIVTASNLCKNALKRKYRKDEPIENYVELAAPQDEHLALAEAIKALPAEWKTVCYLYYYEGYSTKDIASLLHCPHATVRTHLARARGKLKSLLGGDMDEL